MAREVPSGGCSGVGASSSSGKEIFLRETGGEGSGLDGKIKALLSLAVFTRVINVL
jgi:hypothetical protein